MTTQEDDDAWRDNLVTDPDEVRDILAIHATVAVLGIKPESRAHKAAYYVPAYMQEHGYDIIPVPVYYPEVTQILGQPIQRDLTAIEAEVDILNVFRRSEDIPPHAENIVALGPNVVWMQLGIRHDEVAEMLARAGIRVIQDRCMLADHRHFGLGMPSAHEK